MKSDSSNRKRDFRQESYGVRLLGTIVVLIIILYTVSLMVEKLRF